MTNAVSHKTTIKLECETKINQVLAQILDRLGPELTLKVMAILCFDESIDKTSFPSCLLGTKKDVKNIEAGFVLTYVAHNWKKLVKPAEKYWKTLNELKEAKSS